MRPADFHNDDNWLGSFYELAIDLGPVREDWTQILDGFRAIWSAPGVRGPYQRHHERHNGSTDVLTDLSPDEYPMPEILDDFVYHMYGQIEVGAGNWLGCGACKVREGQGTDIVDGHDWLVFYIPTGMLELKFDVRYVPWLQPGPWVDIVDSSLVRVANHIYQQLPFDLAFVGEEMSGEGNTSYVSRKTAEFGGVLFSPDLANRLAPDVPCTVLDSGLRWYPPSWDTSVGFES